MVKLVKVISGGQIGADQAGLFAARDCNIETGGFAPKGYLTENGNDISLKTKFGLEEPNFSGYPIRTRLNVAHSDGTLVFGNHNSPGCKLTINICKELKKPYLVVSGNTKQELVVPVIGTLRQKYRASGWKTVDIENWDKTGSMFMILSKKDISPSIVNKFKKSEKKRLK